VVVECPGWGGGPNHVVSSMYGTLMQFFFLWDRGGGVPWGLEGGRGESNQCGFCDRRKKMSYCGQTK
jgi:hypothetical protein